MWLRHSSPVNAWIGRLVVGVCLAIGNLPSAYAAKSLTGLTPGNAEFINGYGRQGEPMIYCPTNCTGNSDFATHTDGGTWYWKYWDLTGWYSPMYSEDSKQEIKANLVQEPQQYIQSGVSMLCKKPYDVCDYPNGDVYVRQNLELLLKKTTKGECQISMKVFLCALYRRKCAFETDRDPRSKTYGMRAIKPVCWPQCWNAYMDCGFGREHAILMCSEYIKAGWVQYDFLGKQFGCDSSALRLSWFWHLQIYLCVLLLIWQAIDS